MPPLQSNFPNGDARLNILVAIERLKEIALTHPDAVIQGYVWTSESFDDARHIEVQADPFENVTRVYFERD